MAARLAGRTDNEIKNYWHTHLKKRSKTINLERESIVNFEAQDESQNPDSEDSSASSSHLEVEVSMLSEAVKGVETRGSLCFSDGFEGNFWTEPFLVDNSYTQDHIHSFSPFMEEAAMYLFT